MVRECSLPSTLDHRHHVFVVSIEWVVKGEETKHYIIRLFGFNDNLHLTALCHYELGGLHDDLVLLNCLRLER